MNDAIETIEYKDKTIKIFRDECDWSPRENDNICIIHLAHKRYSFGDENHSCLEDIQKAERDALSKGDICLPFYMYDHSGVTISLSPFSCPWDSGQCGFVQVRKSEIMDNWGKKNWTKGLREKAVEVAESEIKELDSFLIGDVYLYEIDEDERCGGYIGDIKYCIDDAKAAVDHLINNLPEGEKANLIEV